MELERSVGVECKPFIGVDDDSLWRMHFARMTSVSEWRMACSTCEFIYSWGVEVGGTAGVGGAMSAVSRWSAIPITLLAISGQRKLLCHKLLAKMINYVIQWLVTQLPVPISWLLPWRRKGHLQQSEKLTPRT